MPVTDDKQDDSPLSAVPDHLQALARELLAMADARKICIAAAESCTGGLLASLLTDVEGFSHCFEAGFVVYSDEAKQRQLGVPAKLIEKHTAVSREVAREMAVRARAAADAAVAVSITGYAGPGGDDAEEGLVHFGLAGPEDSDLALREEHFGPQGRDRVRLAALAVALEMLRDALDHGRPAQSATEEGSTSGPSEGDEG